MDEKMFDSQGRPLIGQEMWTAFAKEAAKSLRSLADEVDAIIDETDISYLRRSGEIVNAVTWSVANLRLGTLIRRAERIEANEERN